MARVTKIDNVSKKRFERQEKRRAIGTRDRRVYFLIVCEGEKTEPNYFKGLRNDLPPETLNVIDMTIEGTARNTTSLIDCIIDYKKKANRNYDSVWAVFDRDSFTEQQFNSAIITAKANGIKCAWSNEAFELWYLLHFQLIENAMSRHDYKSFLEAQVNKKLSKSNYAYKKNATDTYLMLNKHGDQNQAIMRAKKLADMHEGTKFANHNPSTRVHELVEELFNPSQVLKNMEENNAS
jgi:hypothetical protein